MKKHFLRLLYGSLPVSLFMGFIYISSTNPDLYGLFLKGMLAAVFLMAVYAFGVPIEEIVEDFNTTSTAEGGAGSE